MRFVETFLKESFHAFKELPKRIAPSNDIQLLPPAMLSFFAKEESNVTPPVMKGANMTKEYSLGIDIGSTTVKTVLRENDRVVFEKYERHMSRVR